MKRRTDYFSMKVCVTLLFSTIVLECLVLQGVQGETHPGLLGDGFPGPYNLEQQAQLYQTQFLPSGSSDLQTSLFDFFRGGRFKLPQRRISFNKQDSLGYTFGHTQNAQQNFGFVSPSNEGNYQSVPETRVKGPINLSSVATIGPTYAPFVTAKDRILTQQVQPTQVPLSAIHATSANPIVSKSFSHPRFPFSSQGASLFPNSQQVVQNVPPASSSPGSTGSISFPQNPTLSSVSSFLNNDNYYYYPQPQRVSSQVTQNFRRSKNRNNNNYYNSFPSYSFTTSQFPQQNSQSQFDPNLLSNSGQFGNNPPAPQIPSNPISTVSPYTLQPSTPTQSPALQSYPQQNSLTVSYLTNNPQSIVSNSPVTIPQSVNNFGTSTSAADHQPHQVGIGNLGISSNNNLALSSQTAQDAAVSKILATPTPVYQQVKELSQKSITYQFNPDSSITPLQISKGDIPTLEHPHTNSNSNERELVNLVNRVVSGSKVVTKNKGNIGVSNPLVFPTNAPQTSGIPSFSPPTPTTPFPQNNLPPVPPPQQPQLNSFPQNPQQNQQYNFPPGPPPPPGQPGNNFPPFGPQGPNNNGPPPPELENGYNPNHLATFPEPPYESEYLNDPLDARDASELEAYLETLRAQGRRAPASQNIVFPGDEGNYRILNPSGTSGSSAPLAGLNAEEAVRIANEKPVPPQCAYNTITQGSQGEECIGVKK